MRIPGVLAAVSLALLPALASAGSAANVGQDTADTKVEKERPPAGSLAVRELSHSQIPVGAIVVGGLVILGGVLIGVLASGGGSDSNNNTNNVPQN